jgi:hypothetical protein
MFDEFLEEAVNETYDWVKAFGRNIPMYDKIVSKYVDIPIYKDYGTTLSIGGVPHDFNKLIDVKLTEPSDIGGAISYLHEEIKISNEKVRASVTLNYIFTVYSRLDGLECETVVKKQSKVYTPFIIEGGDFPFDSNENGDVHEIYRVDMKIMVEVAPSDVESISKGTYVEYRTDFSDDSVFDLYKVNADCTNADWMDYSCKLDYDPRGCVLYILERKDYFDKNILTSTDRALKEAIINRIIYLWFEYVNAPEADKYLLKFEDYGHKAQLGMNTRAKDIQRKYKLF